MAAFPAGVAPGALGDTGAAEAGADAAALAPRAAVS